MKLAAFENINEGQRKATKKKPQNGNKTSAFLGDTSQTWSDRGKTGHSGSQTRQEQLGQGIARATPGPRDRRALGQADRGLRAPGPP